jgi:hypothetical protein
VPSFAESTWPIDTVEDSLNGELKFAGLFSDDRSAVQPNATLNSAEFSSMTGFTRRYRQFALQVSNSANRRSLTANSKYDFDSGFDAATACINTSAAPNPAVQRLNDKAVSGPRLRRLSAVGERCRLVSNVKPAGRAPVLDAQPRRC